MELGISKLFIFIGGMEDGEMELEMVLDYMLY